MEKVTLKFEIIGIDETGIIYDWDVVAENENKIDNYNNEMGVF